MSVNAQATGRAGAPHLLFATGGTGGHIYPALAVAQEDDRSSVPSGDATIPPQWGVADGPTI